MVVEKSPPRRNESVKIITSRIVNDQLWKPTPGIWQPRHVPDSGNDDSPSERDESSRSLRRSAKRKVGQAARSNTTARAISSLEEKLAAYRRERKIGKGTLRDTHVAAFRGYVSDGHAHIRIRVTEMPYVPDATELVADPKVVRTNLRRFVALAFPGVRLRVILGEEQVDVETDRHGYATAHIPAPDLLPGWHDYHAVTIPDNSSEAPIIASGEVLLPDPRAPFAVVSDIDDTVLRTGLTEGFVAVRQTLLGSASTRREIPGMPALYQGLAAGIGNRPEPAFYYLSTGPWNLYDMLTEFLDIRGFPRGVLHLTDWGPQERYVMRSGKEHKRLSLARMFASFPKTKFVLIGDSGQNDPYVYVEAAREHPRQVRAIVILDVGDHMAQRAQQLVEWQVELAAEGIPFYFVDDARQAAELMVQHRMVKKDVVERVTEQILERGDA